MIALVLPSILQEKLSEQLKRSGKREIGGILMAEHTGHNQFVLRDMTFHRPGSFASFIRRIEEALGLLASFFDETMQEYKRFNYIGEWHSHPSFGAEPSARDDESMRAIVEDSDFGGNFAVLCVVRLNSSGELDATVHTYLRDGSKHRGSLKLQ